MIRGDDIFTLLHDNNTEQELVFGVVITQLSGCAFMLPDATGTVTLLDTWPPAPVHVSVYDVFAVGGLVTLFPVALVPTESDENSPPVNVQEVTLDTPSHESVARSL